MKHKLAVHHKSRLAYDLYSSSDFRQYSGTFDYCDLVAVILDRDRSS